MLILLFLYPSFPSIQSSPPPQVFTACPDNSKGCSCSTGWIPCNVYHYNGQEEYFGCIENKPELIPSCCPNTEDWLYITDSFFNENNPPLTCMKRSETLVGIQKLTNHKTMISCSKPNQFSCHLKHTRISPAKTFNYFYHECRDKSNKCSNECFQGKKLCKNQEICIDEKEYTEMYCEKLRKRFHFDGPTNEDKEGRMVNGVKIYGGQKEKKNKSNTRVGEGRSAPAIDPNENTPPPFKAGNFIGGGIAGGAVLLFISIFVITSFSKKRKTAAPQVEFIEQNPDYGYGDEEEENIEIVDFNEAYFDPEDDGTVEIVDNNALYGQPSLDITASFDDKS